MGGKLRRAIIVLLLAVFGLLVGFRLVAEFSPTNVNARGAPSETKRTGTLIRSFAAAEGRKLISASQSVLPHCPYYPPDVDDVPFIFSPSTVHQFVATAKKYPQDRPILLLVVNEGGLPLLANWLCVSARHIAIESVLVVIPPEENGTRFESTLTRKGITAIQTRFSQECLDKLDSEVHFEPSRAALLVRVMSIMLLTDWGYDVAVLDPDAFVLQEPFEMYRQVVQKLNADIIGQQARFPFDIGLRLGFTLCMGAAFYRGSSKPLKSLWREMSRLHFSKQYAYDKHQYDDQDLTNTALYRLGLTSWDQHDSLYNSSSGTAGEVTAVALGVGYSARVKLTETLDWSQLRILHPRVSKQNKEVKIQGQGLWKLPVLADYTDALATDSIQTLSAWLEQICLP